MNIIEQTQTRRQHMHRRLRELEVAVGIAGEPGLTWHIRQALRSGASRVEVRQAVQSGLSLAGQPATVCSYVFTRRRSGASSGPTEVSNTNRRVSLEGWPCLVSPVSCGVR